MSETARNANYFRARTRRRKLLEQAVKSPKALNGESKDTAPAVGKVSAPVERSAPKGRLRESGPNAPKKAPEQPRLNVEALYNNIVKSSRTKHDTSSAPTRSAAPGRVTASSKPSAAPKAAERGVPRAASAPRAASTPSPKPRPVSSQAPLIGPKPEPRSLISEKKRKRKPFEGSRAIRRGEDVSK